MTTAKRGFGRGTEMRQRRATHDYMRSARSLVLLSAVLLFSVRPSAHGASYTPAEEELMGAVFRLATHGAVSAADEGLLRSIAKESPEVGFSAFDKAMRDRRFRRGKPPGVLDVLHVLDAYFAPGRLYALYGEGLGEIPALLRRFQTVDAGHWSAKNWQLCEMLSSPTYGIPVSRSAENRLKRMARIPECLMADLKPTTAFGFAALGYGLHRGPYTGREVDGLPSPQERTRRALNCLNRAVELDGRLAEARLWRAQVLLAMGDAEPAMEDADRAVAGLPDSSEAYAIRARCCRALGENAEAYRDEKRCEQLRVAERVAWVRSPEGNGKLLFRAFTHIRGSLHALAEGRRDSANQETDSALKICQELVDCSPEDPMLRLARALLGVHAEQWEAVMEDAASLIDLVPGSAYGYLLRARAARTLGRDSSAEEAAYGRALAEAELPIEVELPMRLGTVERGHCTLTVEDVKGLAQNASGESAARLTEVLIATDAAKDVWEAAYRALKGLPDEALRKALPQLHTYVLKCARSDTRQADEPVALLGRLNDPASADYLLMGLLRDGEGAPAIRHRAGLTLGEFPPNLAVPALRKALASGFARNDDWVLGTALSALDDIDPAVGRQFLGELLLKGTRAQQVRAALALSMDLQTVSILALAEVVTDTQTDPSIRREAGTALGHPHIAGTDVAAWARAQVERGVG